MYKVLVCGGRKYGDYDRVELALNEEMRQSIRREGSFLSAAIMKNVIVSISDSVTRSSVASAHI